MTVWSEFVSYRCRHPDCQEQCLNHLDLPWTQTKECRTCHGRTDPDDLPPLSHHLPSDFSTSEGETSRVSAGASAPSAGSGESAGSGGLAPDPEARAQGATARERESRAGSRVASERSASPGQE